MKKQPKGHSLARERIVTTALQLFNRQGIHHTGTEQIIAESRVAKMTFYKHFPSKSKLIREYLQIREDFWFTMLRASTDQSGLTDEQQVLALFDALHSWFQKPDFHGCPFIRGMSDLKDSTEDEISFLVSDHFRRTEEFIVQLLSQAKIKKTQAIAAQILSLVLGTIVIFQATKLLDVVESNRESARKLLALSR